MTTPAETLLKAAGVIERDGWMQGNLDDGDAKRGRVCALGAINRAMHGSSLIIDFDERPAIIRYLGQAIGGNNVTLWNDNPERTAEDVILAFKHAAHMIMAAQREV